MSILNFYCLKNASAKSLHFLTLVLSNVIYQFNAEPVKLSWKKWMSNLSLCMTSTILLQHDLKCVLRHSNPYYFTNYKTLNSLGTRHISAALTGSWTSYPSTTLNLSSQVAYLSCLGWLKDLTSWGSPIIRSIMVDTWAGIIRRVIRMLVVPCGLVVGFPFKFCGSMIIRDVAVVAKLVVDWMSLPQTVLLGVARVS